MPAMPLFETVVLVMANLTVPAVGRMAMPLPDVKKLPPKKGKFCATQLVTVRLPPELKTTPLKPPLVPSSVSPRRTIASLGPALIVMAFPPETGTIPASTPSGLVMETDLVMLIGPKPALSIAVTSPPASTTLTACWKFLHGDKNVHGLASLP